MAENCLELLIPRDIKVERLSSFKSKITLEPFERGFGHISVMR